MTEKFPQASKKSSQGRFLLFYYDKRMETSDQPEVISIIGWKSYKLKRCTTTQAALFCSEAEMCMSSLLRRGHAISLT